MRQEKVIIMLSCLLIFSVTFGVYISTLNNGFLPEWDDSEYVLNNYVVLTGLTIENIKNAFTTTVSENWHPLSIISHMIDVHFFGLNPLYHHLVSTLIHCLNSILVFTFFNRTTRNIPAALSVALIFGTHPLHVESVAWVAERKDLISSFFILAAINTYAMYSALAESTKKKLLYIFTCLLYLLGLLSKSMVITFPIFILILDYWPLNRLNKLNIKSLLIEKIPFILFSIVFVLITLMTQKHKSINLFDNMLIAAYSYCKQSFSFLLPYKLSYLYSYSKRPSELALVTSFIIFIVISIVIYKYAKDRCITSGWLMYTCLYLPVCGIVTLGRHLYSDRYVYLPMLGLCILLVYGVIIKHKYLLTAIPIFLVFISSTTIAYEKTWNSFFTLNKNALHVGSLAGKDYIWAHSVLAKEYYQNGNYELAKFHLQKVLINDFKSDAKTLDVLASSTFYTLNDYSQMFLEANFMDILINSYMSLTDIYLRELDYKNARVVIDKGLAFQPNNTFLLTQKINLKAIGL